METFKEFKESSQNFNSTRLSIAYQCSTRVSVFQLIFIHNIQGSVRKVQSHRKSILLKERNLPPSARNSILAIIQVFLVN